MYAARTGPSHGLGNMDKKFGENRTYSSWDVIADRQTHTHRETDRQTEQHAHHNTMLPYRRWSKYVLDLHYAS